MTSDIVNITACRNIYKILTLACIDQVSNKAHMAQYIKPVILPHIKKEHQVGAHLLLKEIIKDNKTVLLDIEAIEVSEIV